MISLDNKSKLLTKKKKKKAILVKKKNHINLNSFVFFLMIFHI